VADSGWDSEWDEVFDVVVVGGGAAGLAAAVAASRDGLEVALLERATKLGGTTAKSGGSFWVPNNSSMRSAGHVDSRDDALRYLARLGFPTRYDPHSECLGLSRSEYELLATFYDKGSEALDELKDLGALYPELVGGNEGRPDYHADLPENRGIRGRSLRPTWPPGEPAPPEFVRNGADYVGGMILVEVLRRAAERQNVVCRTQHRVVHVVRNDDNEVIGVQAEARLRATLIGSRRAVVFGSGGFLNNRERAQRFLRGPVFGGTAVETNSGDLVDIAGEVGAQLGNMSNAWWDQCIVEVALRVPSTTEDIFFPYGDSMIQVNKYGKRVVNEKQVYNERGQVHFYWSPDKKEYPNLLLFQIWDEPVAANLDGSIFRRLIPTPEEHVDYVIEADGLDDLAIKIQARLDSLAASTGGLSLSPDFLSNLRTTITRFNRYADTGVDPEFGRGESPIQRDWQGPARPGISNPCMAQLDVSGRLYAMILGAGALDTNGGPRISSCGQILGRSGSPIAGLYGAGNCIASPLGQAYPGGGGTLGLALVFGYLAGRSAAQEHSKRPTNARI
jgi:3-oxosteroid 1-dehydrogenase